MSQAPQTVLLPVVIHFLSEGTDAECDLLASALLASWCPITHPATAPTFAMSGHVTGQSADNCALNEGTPSLPQQKKMRPSKAILTRKSFMVFSQERAGSSHRLTKRETRTKK
jgi:hypothetical protein